MTQSLFSTHSSASTLSFLLAQCLSSQKLCSSVWGLLLIFKSEALNSCLGTEQGAVLGTAGLTVGTQGPEGLSSWPVCQEETPPSSPAGGHWAAMAQVPGGSESGPCP